MCDRAVKYYKISVFYDTVKSYKLASRSTVAVSEFRFAFWIFISLLSTFHPHATLQHIPYTV